jgi:hypothetical protein
VDAILKIGTLICWAVGIGSEYLAQKYSNKKRLFTLVAVFGFAFALLGEYVSYRYDANRESRIEARINAQGVPEVRWFQASDQQGSQTFSVPDDPFPGSVSVLVNGLEEPPGEYSVQGRNVKLSMRLSHFDIVIIKYRRKP